MKLGTLLLRNAAIGLAQLEAALRNQVLYGGRLGTNLVELGFLDLDLLGTYLAEVSGLPQATRALLDTVPKDILALVGAEMAHELGAIPLARLADGSGALAVAMTEPNFGPYLEALTAKVKAPIAPYVIPELRAHYYLERHYGVARSARFVRPGTRRIASASTERRKTQPPGGMIMPTAVTLTPRARRPPTEPPLAMPGVTPSLGYDDAVDRIDGAAHREQIGDALVDFGRGRFDALIVFIVRDGNALGWRGHVATTMGAHTKIEELALPLGGASVLQAAHDAMRMYLGAAPAAARSIERELWTAIGCDPEPKEMMVAPIVVKQRVVNLVYAHGLRGRPLEPLAADQLHALCGKAEEAYLRLIVHSKQGH